MSATQDASDLAENLVALDTECRDLSFREECVKFTAPMAYTMSSVYFEAMPIYEGQSFKLVGIDVQSDAQVRVIMAIEDDDLDDEDPFKWHIDVYQLQQSFPQTFKAIERVVANSTDASNLATLNNRVYQTFAGKPALYDVLHQTLKAGRRSYLEMKAEREEETQAAFYERSDSFGTF